MIYGRLVMWVKRFDGEALVEFDEGMEFDSAIPRRGDVYYWPEMDGDYGCGEKITGVNWFGPNCVQFLCEDNVNDCWNDREDEVYGGGRRESLSEALNDLQEAGDWRVEYRATVWQSSIGQWVSTSHGMWDSNCELLVLDAA